MSTSIARQTGFGLGLFSLALGAAELLAPRRIAEALGLDPDGPATTTLRAFGLREVAAGALLVRGPAVSFNAWNRVAGDLLDLAALAIAARSTRRPMAVAAAMTLVGAVTVLDGWTARKLDEETGRTLALDNGMTDIQKG